MFSAARNGNIVDVVSLDFKTPAKQHTYFPVIPVDAGTYDVLFCELKDREIWEQLFYLSDNRRFRSASSPKSKDFLQDYILESAFRRLQSAMNNDKALIEEIFNQICGSDHYFSCVSFALFCYLTSDNIDSVQSVLETAVSLGGGIRQLVQNSVQYSQLKKGVFSFYLDQDHPDQNGHPSLRILVADLNFSYSMTEKFADTIDKESKVISDSELQNVYNNLYMLRDQFSIRDLLADYSGETMQEEWRAFRRRNASSHVGLLLFAIAVERSGGRILVCSSSKYLSDVEHNFYYADYSGPKEKHNWKATDDKRIEAVIPGTQYSIWIPSGEISCERVVGLGQLHKPSILDEGYESFSEFIGCRIQNVSPDAIFSTVQKETNAFDVSDNEKKIQAITNCTLKWQDILKAASPGNEKNDAKAHRIIYCMDLNSAFEANDVMHPDSREIFVKSFLDSLDKAGEFCFEEWAFINADKEFMDAWRDVCISFSAREFPVGFQLFVGGKDPLDTMILLGGSYYEALYNGYLLSMEQGTRLLTASEYLAARGLFTRINGTEDSGIAIKDREDQAVRVIPFDVLLGGGQAEKESIFERRLSALSDEDIEEGNSGYKIRHTHMRLGSKVHIQSFYELSFLFYRTGIANRIAFLILETSYEKSSIN